MLNRNRFVRLITRLGNVAAESVVNLNHGLLEFVKLQLTRNTCALPLPFVTNVSVTSARSGATSINAEVEPERCGFRNITIPFEPSDGNGSKSVMSCEKSGPDAEFVT